MMETLLIGLIGSSPAGAAAIVMSIIFLRHLREERIASTVERQEASLERMEMRAAITTALNQNTEIVRAHVEAMATQAEALKALTVAIDHHHEMAMAALARLMGK